MFNLYQFLINCYTFWSGNNNWKFYKAKTMKINFFSFGRYLLEILFITNFLKWVHKTKKYNRILCLILHIIIFFCIMDFSHFSNPRCYDRYLLFIWVETNPKIQIAKNPSCIQYRNRSLLTHKRFFYHGETSPTKFPGQNLNWQIHSPHIQSCGSCQNT